jgi:hypothetical protein
MKDVTGKGANKNYAPIRTDLGQHDMTGGNTFVPELIKTQFGTDPSVDLDAIDAGILRARFMLQNAATMNLTVLPNGDTYEASVEIINETGHKLPSGYPEGRRMWINVEAYDINDNLVYESGAYDDDTAVLSKLDTNNNDTKIYECKLGMSQAVADVANANESNPETYAAGESFHFALNNMVVKDNRIPPRGFTNANFASVQAAPVGYSYADGAFSDVTTYSLPSDTYKVEAKLYYQTVSKEYIDFLDAKNVTDNKGSELKTLWASHGKSAPELMEEAEFYTNTLSLEDESILDNYINIYPNPANDHAFIDIEFKQNTNFTIGLFDLNGKIIKSIASDKNFFGSQKLKINTDNLSAGMYILKFDFNNISTYKKLLVQ